MKRQVFFIIFSLAATFYGFAQDYQDVVYLRDGSIMRGYIIEQVPNDYLKIETTSGRVYTIDMYDVDIIKKEKSRAAVQNNTRQRTNQYSYPNYQNQRAPSNYRQQYDYDYYDNNYYNHFPNRGYKGFIDLGFSNGTTTKRGSYSYDGINRFEFSTSHGFFLNPYFFVGMGMGIHYYFNEEDFEDYLFQIPIFVHFRTHFVDATASPFADFKLGYSVYDIKGTYVTPAIGCRFAKGSRSSFWISLGYSFQYADNTDFSMEAVSFKLGWDF